MLHFQNRVAGGGAWIAVEYVEQQKDISKYSYFALCKYQTSASSLMSYLSRVKEEREIL